MFDLILQRGGVGVQIFQTVKLLALPTISMKWIAHFVVGILLLHHYRSNLAYLSDLYSLVIGMYKYQI